MKKRQKQRFALALCASLLLCSFGGPAFAEEPAVAAEKICAHHPAHTAECGYVEETPGHVCGHEHTRERYTSPAICGYSDLDASHTHFQECYEIDCAHERGEHDDGCGYIAETAENPCGYACEICDEPSIEKLSPEPEQESGAITVVTGFEGLEEDVQYQTAAPGAGLDALIFPTVLSARGYVEGEENAPDSIAVPVEKWEPDRPYGESAGPGSYLFTPVLPAGYSLSGGAELPEIYVKTGEITALSAAPKQNGDTLTVTFSDNNNGGTDRDNNEMKTAIENALTTQNILKENVTKIELTGNVPEITGYNWRYLLERYRADNPNDNWPKLTALDLSKMNGLTAIRNDTGFSVGPISKMTTAVLPDSLTSIGDRAFWDCTQLVLTALPDGVTSIGQEAFSGCTQLALTALPDGVTSIGNSAFQNCAALALTALPDGVTSIGNSAFYGCTKLALTALPKGVTSIGNAAFQNCTQLALTALPDGVTSIGNSAFSGCTALALTALPDGLTSIGEAAFWGCTGLTQIALPKGLTSIGNAAFQNCTQLALTALPDGLTSIGDYAFYGCTGLTQIALPDRLTSIGNSAFYNCTGLNQITLPDRLTSIEDYAFYNCTNLTEVIMTSRAAPSLGEYVFNGTNSGLIIYIPQNGTGYDQGEWASLASKLKRYVVPTAYVPVNGISLDQSSCSLYMGETATLTALVSPYNASVKTVSWSSDNPEVAEVDGTGTVTALSVGTAVITAVSQDSGQKASCTVSVKAYPLIGGFSYVEETWEPASAAVTVSERPVPDTPTVAEISLSTTMENQIAMGTVSDRNTQREIRNAKDAAQRKNRLSCGISVQYKAKLPLDCNGFSIVLRRETLERLIAANVTGATFSTGLAKLSFDLAALREIAATSIGDVTLTAAKETALSGEMREAIGERPVLRFTVNVVGQNAEKTVLSSFGKGRVTLEILYIPEDGEQTGSLFLVREGENGVEWLSQSVYDRNSGAVTVSTGHFSLFGVGYKAAPAYADTEKHWAGPDIAFAVSRGLLNGDSETTFHPDRAITRSDLAAALGRLAGINSADDSARSFFDIPADADYAPYAVWAVSNNIMSGTEGKNFSPNGAISREETAVILQKYAVYRNVSLPALRKAEFFTDEDQVANSMKSAVQILRQSGMMGCKEDGRFAPRDFVTRAEAAVFLRRFVAVLTAPSANGWIQNDVGRWQYTLNGRPVTGWKQIEGNWYYFDMAGLMASGGWKQISQKQYFFYPNGVMAANAVIDGYALGPDGARKE